MKSSFPSSKVGLVAATALCGWSVLVVAIQRSTDYETGLKALQDGRFAEAVESLEKAISAQPEPSSTYYPYFHLGKAHRCLGNQEKAVAMFEESFVRNELGTEPQLMQALELQLSGDAPACEDIPQMPPPLTTTTTVMVRPMLVSTTSVEPRTTSTVVEPRTTSIVVELRTTSTVAPWATTSVVVAQGLDGILEDLRALIEAGTIKDAWEKLGEAESLDSNHPDVVALHEKLVEAARGKARGAMLSQMQGQHEKAISDLEDAVAALSDRSAVHLYLAWACYAKYLAGGAEESELADKARAQIREALRLDPDIEADPRVFSPRFRELLKQIREEVRQ